MKNLIIFGITELAELASYYFSCGGKYKIIAFTVESNYLNEEVLQGLPVVPFDNVECVYPPLDYDMFIAIGYSEMNRLRESKCKEAIEKGYTLVSYISDKAVVSSDLVYGYNCFMLEHTILQPFVRLGNNIIVMNKSLISHHCVIEDNCYISANVTICGSVEVKNNCFFGACSCIRDGIVIAPYTLVGANAYIAQNTEIDGVYIAESARKTEKVSSRTIIRLNSAR